MNLIDWIVSSVNPHAGLKRAAARKLLRGFEAADRGRRTEGWRTQSTDANSEVRKGSQLLRDRARDMRRNDPYAERGVSLIASNVVGYGIVPDPRGRPRQKKRALALWRQWAETTACDFFGQTTLYGLQAQAMEAAVESGEVLLRRVWTPGRNLMNFQIQLLEADYLDESRDRVWEGGAIVDGIEYDVTGHKVAYWLHPQHPGNGQRLIMSTESIRVPAEDIRHFFIARRPGQSRGYSWLAPVMLRMRNFNELEDAVMEQAKVAACFSVIITTNDNGGLGTPSTAQHADPLERLEPGIIERIAQGESVQFGTPPTFNGYSTYAKESKLAVSVGLGVPYEALSGDLSGVNFTSGRMGWLEFGRSIDRWRWNSFVPIVCNGVWEWFNDACMLAVGETFETDWVAPRRDLIDPSAELDAIEKEMRLGGLSYTGMLKERGINDTEAHIQQIRDDNAALDAAGLIFDGDPRNVAKAGAGAVDSPTTTTDAPDAQAQ